MATNRSFRKSQLIAFDNVAAGHDGVLSDPTGELVVKPCKQSEIDFYESTSAHPEFIPHIPTFIGKISLGADTNAAQAAGALVLPGATDSEPSLLHGVPGTMVVENAWAPSNGGRIHTDSAVVLENVAAGFKKPNILDVKLGARLWADDAPMAKRVKLDKVAEETTSKPLGLRIAGMKTYQGAASNGKQDVTPDGYRHFDKNYGRSFSAETIAQGFEEYFQLTKGVKAKGQIRKAIRRFVEDLRAMESVIKKEESRMYSASLLLVYEGDQQALQDAFAAERDIIVSLDRKVSRNDPVGGNGTADHNHLHTGNGTANGNDKNGDVNVEDRDDEEEAEGEEEEVKFPAIQSLKLIDFAHAEWTPGQGPDENILHGIRNTIDILSSLMG